jgi:hypothetical protein
MARLRPWKKPEQPTDSAAPTPAGRITPDPMRENRRRPPAHVWKAGQKRRTPPLPRLLPGQAEAMAAAEHARRQAEEQAERARVRAELAAEKAKHEAFVAGLWAEWERGSLWISPGDNGHGDVKRIKF